MEEELRGGMLRGVRAGGGVGGCWGAEKRGEGVEDGTDVHMRYSCSGARGLVSITLRMMRCHKKDTGSEKERGGERGDQSARDTCSGYIAHCVCVCVFAKCGARSIPSR